MSFHYDGPLTTLHSPQADHDYRIVRSFCTMYGEMKANGALEAYFLPLAPSHQSSCMRPPRGNVHSGSPRLVTIDPCSMFQLYTTVPYASTLSTTGVLHTTACP